MKAIIMILSCIILTGCSRVNSNDSISSRKQEINLVKYQENGKTVFHTPSKGIMYSGNCKLFIEVGDYWTVITAKGKTITERRKIKTENLLSFDIWDHN